METNKNNFREIILNFPKQVASDLPFFNQLNLQRRPFDKIIVCGMGGSALMRDILDYLKNHGESALACKVPILAHRSYGLPKETTYNSLVIASSYSGNPEETLSSFQRAREEDLEIAAITSGGQLAELCQQNKIPWVKLPEGFPPRESLGFQLMAVVKILMAYGLLNLSAQNRLLELPEKISPALLEDDAQLLCQKLTNKIPLIYASQDNEVIARVWKIKFNENTKIPAFYNCFPELNHNEMTGWTKNLGPFVVLMLKDEADLPRIQKRIELTAQLLTRTGLPVHSIKLSGANALEKFFRATILGNWLSYHLALYYGVDPLPVGMVEEFKKMMKD